MLQYCTVLQYLNGLGVDMDESKAIEWFKKAADDGDSDAMYSTV